MNQEKLKSLRIISMIIAIFGLTLIVYMIWVEGELGALPLFLTLIGIIGIIYSKVSISRFRKQ